MLHLRKGGTDWTLPGILAMGYCTLVGLGGPWLAVLVYPVIHHVAYMAATLANTAVYPTARLGGMPWLAMSIAANLVPAVVACAVHASAGLGWAIASWMVTQRVARRVGEVTFAVVCRERYDATARYFQTGRWP